MRNLVLILACMGLGTAIADVPRTNDGHPDLSGTYDVATLTPLERPDRYHGRATLTDEEAQAVADNSRANLAKDQQPSDPNRGAPAEGGTKFYIPEIELAA
ncbi:MAG: hypothetical protein O7C67_15870, partial [Gammaproteobacteria bacterium]|nr:hypothetical protein [Gammaproteobacteria bacterium]